MSPILYQKWWRDTNDHNNNNNNGLSGGRALPPKKNAVCGAQGRRKGDPNTSVVGNITKKHVHLTNMPDTT